MGAMRFDSDEREVGGMPRLSGGLVKHLASTTSANYNPVAEAEAILASEALVVA